MLRKMWRPHTHLEVPGVVWVGRTLWVMVVMKQKYWCLMAPPLKPTSLGMPTAGACLSSVSAVVGLHWHCLHQQETMLWP